MCTQHRPGSEVRVRHTGQWEAEAGSRRELWRLWGSHKDEILDLGLRADVWGSGEQEG